MHTITDRQSIPVFPDKTVPFLDTGTESSEGDSRNCLSSGGGEKAHAWLPAEDHQQSRPPVEGGESLGESLQRLGQEGLLLEDGVTKGQCAEGVSEVSRARGVPKIRFGMGVPKFSRERDVPKVSMVKGVSKVSSEMGVSKESMGKGVSQVSMGSG